MKFWLDAACGSADRGKWLTNFVNHLRSWKRAFPEESIRLCHRAIQENWGDEQSLSWNITVVLDGFTAWRTGGLRELFEWILSSLVENHSILGDRLSRWVEATDQGDDLLWQYIIGNVTEGDAQCHRIDQKLRCQKHHFHHEGFLIERLKTSDVLLDLAVASIQKWSRERAKRYGAPSLDDAFLRDSSWRQEHEESVLHHVDALNTLLDDVEEALVYRAERRDVWWRKREAELRVSRESAIRYFLIRAYLADIEGNVAGIERQITDSELLRYGRMNYEIGRLMKEAYPFLSEGARDRNQDAILGLYADEGQPSVTEPDWIWRRRHEYAVWIPSVFRNPEIQSIVDCWEGHFGSWLPGPEVYSWGGFVQSPLTWGQISDLSDEDFLRLLSYYSKPIETESVPGRGLVGGGDTLTSAVTEASSRLPTRFLGLLPQMRQDEDVRAAFMHAVVDGVSQHLRYRFGNLTPGDKWEAMEPLPDGHELAGQLLDATEHYHLIRESEWSVSHAVEACCWVQRDIPSVVRLLFLLFRLQQSPNPPGDKGQPNTDRREELLHTALNSTRGVAAESTMVLTNGLLEAGRDLPELLVPLLARFAHDPAPAVRAAVLRRLPYVLHRLPELGWQLLHETLENAPRELWPHAERCFYSTYRSQFSFVEPYLRRLEEMADAAPETWGRIQALACLAGHVSHEELIDGLSRLQNEEAWLGGTQVFAANIAHHGSTEICRHGLLLVLGRPELTEKQFQAVEACFGDDKSVHCLTQELAAAVLRAHSPGRSGRELHHLLDWLAAAARRDPLAVLPLIEELASRLEATGDPHHLWRPEPLVEAMVEVLREADERDDENLIRKAVGLQDRFLALGIRGVSEMLDAASC